MLNWQERMSRWLDKRIPAANRFKLDHKSIFIFPSKFGALFLFLCFGLFLLGTNYQNNLMIILCYFLVSLFLLNLFITYVNFSKLDLQLGKTHNGFANDSIQVPIWFNQSEQEKQRPNGDIQIGFFNQANFLTLDLDDFSNPAYLALSCGKRGSLKLPRVTVCSYYPLGLFRCWTHLAFQADLLVYPTPLVAPTSLHNSFENQGDNGHQEQTLGYDDFDGLTPYKKGDPLNHVAWKQLAKGQGMISKQFSSQRSNSGWLVLRKENPSSIEQQLSQICYQIMELSKQERCFGLNLGCTQILPSRGNDHQKACLQALALFPQLAISKPNVKPSK